MKYRVYIEVHFVTATEVEIPDNVAREKRDAYAEAEGIKLAQDKEFLVSSLDLSGADNWWVAVGHQLS